VPLYFQVVHGYSVLAAGLLIAPFGLGGALSMPLAGWLSDRIGSRGLARSGAIVLLLCAIGLTRIDANSNAVLIAVTTLVMGLASGTVSAPTMGSLYRALPPAQVPQGSSVLYMLNQLGGSIGIAVVALIVETAAEPVGGFQGVYWFMAVSVAATLAATWFLPGRDNDTTTPAREPVSEGIGV
jgi:nitrate/nitrite transporter NarK